MIQKSTELSMYPLSSTPKLRQTNAKQANGKEMRSIGIQVREKLTSESKKHAPS